MKNFLDEWVGDLLEGRADKGWTPTLFMSPKRAAEYETIAGLPVGVDEALADTDIEVRNLREHKRITELQNAKGEIETHETIVPAGEVMARFDGVTGK